MSNPTAENLAQTLARELPKAELLATPNTDPTIAHVALPRGTVLQTIDLEAFQTGPRRAKLTAELHDAEAFLKYIETHQDDGRSVVWCDFNPGRGRLSFEAVIDEHMPGEPGWRQHRAKFTPRLAVEWLTWTGNNGQDKARTQFEFAKFLEQQHEDVVAGQGLPSGLDILNMAAGFEDTSSMSFKSRLSLQSGKIELEYVDKENEATRTKMAVFEKFQVGIPVFWKRRAPEEKVTAYLLQARLRYRTSAQGVTFWYELIRPDLVHEKAALDVIAAVQAGLQEQGVRMLFGTAS